MLEMIGALGSGLVQCFTWSTFSLMCIGIAIGFVVGILPGLGGPTAMALMLPFIFKMSAVEAFAFLLGMTAVTATTGDITSVVRSTWRTDDGVNDRRRPLHGEKRRGWQGSGRCPHEFPRRSRIRRRCDCGRHPCRPAASSFLRLS